MNIIDTLADMMNIGLIGEGIQKTSGILILTGALLWIIIIILVARNINKRTKNIFIQIICIITATIGGPIGGLIYLMVRPSFPSNPLIEGYILCPKCRTENDTSDNYCIMCGKDIKISCKECGNMIHPSFEYCGKCGAPNLSE